MITMIAVIRVVSGDDEGGHGRVPLFGGGSGDSGWCW